MRDDEAFLRAIGDRPEDDLPRLIYADYLEERGNHARAEFIRIGCQRARLGPCHAGWHKLAARELALLADNQPDWEREFEPASIVRFDRGFAAEIEVEAAGFARHYRRILNAGPTPAVSLRNAWEALDDLVRLPVDLGVRELNLADNALTNADLDPLLKAGWIGRIEALNLARNRLGSPAARRIAQSPALTKLRWLTLDHNEIGCGGAASLAAGPSLENLRSLSLVATDLRGSGLAALVNGPALVNLEVLDLRQNPIGGSGFRALLMSPRPQNWKKLSLGRSDLTREQQERLRERFVGVVSFES